MASLRSGNLLLAFLIELGMLAAFCFAGWFVPPLLALRIAGAVLLPGLAIAAWAIWAAPRAGANRLKMPALLYFKIAMFGLATLAWLLAGQGFIGSIFGVLAAINLAVGWMLRQHQPPEQKKSRRSRSPARSSAPRH